MKYEVSHIFTNFVFICLILQNELDFNYYKF